MAQSEQVTGVWYTFRLTSDGADKAGGRFADVFLPGGAGVVFTQRHTGRTFGPADGKIKFYDRPEDSEEPALEYLDRLDRAEQQRHSSGREVKP